MRIFRLEKLVRDKIFDDMLTSGQQVDHVTVSDKKLLAVLADKLIEESKEFDPQADNATKELADILEVIETAAVALGLSFDELRNLQTSRRESRGGFAGRHFVKTVTVPTSDKWADYYAADPEKFPEITT